MVCTKLTGTSVCKLEQLRIFDDTITTRSTLEAMPNLTTLVVVDVIRFTSADVSCIELVFESVNGDTEDKGKVRALVDHAFSMAHNRAKVKGLWTVN